MCPVAADSWDIRGYLFQFDVKSNCHSWFRWSGCVNDATRFSLELETKKNKPKKELKRKKKVVFQEISSATALIVALIPKLRDTYLFSTRDQWLGSFTITVRVSPVGVIHHLVAILNETHHCLSYFVFVFFFLSFFVQTIFSFIILWWRPFKKQVDGRQKCEREKMEGPLNGYVGVHMCAGLILFTIQRSATG